MTPRRDAGLSELAAGEIDADDLRALAQVAALYDRLDPVPAGLVERVNFGLTLDALHAEIAELQRSADLVGVRSSAAGEAQTVTFTSSTLTTMITITRTSADQVRIDGWVAPAVRAAVELRTGAGTHRADTDDDGRFVLTSVPRGLAQLVLRPEDPDLLTVVTPSIEL